MKQAKHRVAHCLAGLMLFCGASAPQAWGDWQDDIGHTKLVAALGDSSPDGSLVPISLVEATAGSSDRYFPDTTLDQFDAETDPLGIAVNFIDGTGGQNEGISSHSSNQAQSFFGNSFSIAPAANEVTVYEANDYINDILNLNGSNSTVPDGQPFRVQNFSWIGTFVTANDGSPEPTIGELNNDRETLRRFDYAIDVDNVTALVGLNNNETMPIPHLLSHSYNAIAIGRSDGVHSLGLTVLDNYGVGRSKPELVLPRTTTSAATSAASSAATFLHSASTVVNTDAAQSAAMKAILLAGATKDEFSSWSQIDAGGVWRPLDDTFGAGEMNIYNSYLITLSGQTIGSTAAASPADHYGWDYQTVLPGSNNALLYEIEVPSGSTAEELSVVLAWNATISAPFNTGDPVLADLALELTDSSGATIDLTVGDGRLDGLSDSEVDNVEHVYVTDLEPGVYTLKVSSADISADFGLAWRTSTLFDEPSADFDSDGFVTGADFLILQRGLGTLVNASGAMGDADGDGDVDADDLAVFDASFASAVAADAFAKAISAVPEPSAAALVLMAFIGFSPRRCRNR